MGRIIKLLLIFTIFLISTFYFLSSRKASADTSCQPIYGGGQTCVSSSNISTNKTVLNPETNKMVDSLSINDPKYQPGFITTFQITIKNTGNADISKINVNDIFPQYINFSAGPGNFDNDTKTLSFEVDNLKPNESKTFTIMGRVANDAQIPLNQGVVCVVNRAIAKNMDNPSEIAQDNSRLCIEKKVSEETSTARNKGFPIFPLSKVTITPPTGPNSLVLFLLIPIAGAGYWLRKISK